jgi:hypothetical protein
MYAVWLDLLEKGVPNLILAFVTPFISAFFLYFFMGKLLPSRLHVWGLSALALVYTLWYNLRDPELFGTGYHLLMNIFINFWTLFIIIFVFQGKFWRKLIVWWYFDIIKAMCQAVSYVPILLYHTGRGFSGDWGSVILSVESGTLLQLLYMLTFIPLFLLMGFLSLTIWRQILMRKFYPFYLLIVALPMGLRYSLARVIHPNMGDLFFGILVNFVADTATSYDILSLFGISLSLVASIAVLYYTLSQDRRAAVEAELRESKRVMELEQVRYGEMEQRSEELAKIRHDFNNQLALIVQLVRDGEDSTAQEIITALRSDINQ